MPAENDAKLAGIVAADNSGARQAAQHAAELEKRVVEHQHARDHADEHHLLFELAAVGLQIAIVLASISIVARRQWLLGGGGALGVAAVASSPPGC